jgi:hypothetical protein
MENQILLVLPRENGHVHSQQVLVHRGDGRGIMATNLRELVVRAYRLRWTPLMCLQDLLALLSLLGNGRVRTTYPHRRAVFHTLDVYLGVVIQARHTMSRASMGEGQQLVQVFHLIMLALAGVMLRMSTAIDIGMYSAT